MAEGNDRPASGEVGWGGPTSGQLDGPASGELGSQEESAGGGEAIGAIYPEGAEGTGPPQEGAPGLKEGAAERVASAASDSLRGG